MTENQKKFYETALSYLGKDATPSDIVSDKFACAITINALHKIAFGFAIGGGASTYLLYRALLNSEYFEKIDRPEVGCVIISPSGYGCVRLPNGHAGIVCENEDIMSNNSRDGLLKKNYTLTSWRSRYVDIGSYPVFYFRRI